MSTIDIVFDGPPGPVCGRFVEVEDSATRAGLNVGEWVHRDDGYWVLRILIPNPVERNVVRTGRNNPSTSHDAAQRALPRQGTLRAVIHYWLSTQKGQPAIGMTDHELERATGRSHQSVSAARNTLMRDGWVVDSGEKRLLPNGNKAIVWKVADAQP